MRFQPSSIRGVCPSTRSLDGMHIEPTTYQLCATGHNWSHFHLARFSPFDPWECLLNTVRIMNRGIRPVISRNQRESSDIIANHCLRECDVGLGTGLNMRRAVRYMGDKPYQGQDVAASRWRRCLKRDRRCDAHSNRLSPAIEPVLSLSRNFPAQVSPRSI
jgi:hypothetical protein